MLQIDAGMRKRMRECRALFEMWAVMLAFGVILEVFVLILTKRWVYYSIGVWAGTALSVVISGLMLRAISNTLDRGETGATAYAIVQYVLRAVIVVVVLFGMTILDLGSPVTALISMFSLKLSAYLQPYLHKLSSKEETHSKAEKD